MSQLTPGEFHQLMRDRMKQVIQRFEQLYLEDAPVEAFVMGWAVSGSDDLQVSGGGNLLSVHMLLEGIRHEMLSSEQAELVEGRDNASDI